MDEQIGITIFGLGRAGMIHFKNLIRNHRVVLHYIVEMDVNRAQDLIEKCHLRETKALAPEHATTAYTDPRVQAVVVCTPTFTHEQIVRTALQNGKGVFCEKPIAETVESTQACYEEAERAGLPLLCSFNRRFDPGLIQIKNRIDAGEIGDVHLIKTCSRDSPFPSLEYLKISGGIFHDCAVHDIDVICWMLGEYPESVFTQAHAQSKALRELDDVDTVVISMRFPSGILACVDLSRMSSYGYDQRVEILGSEGMIQNENQFPNAVVASTKAGVHNDILKFSFPQRYAEAYDDGMNHFLDVVQGKAEIRVLKAETLQVSRIATACEDSWRQGKAINTAAL